MARYRMYAQGFDAAGIPEHPVSFIRRFFPDAGDWDCPPNIGDCFLFSSAGPVGAPSPLAVKLFSKVGK